MTRREKIRAGARWLVAVYANGLRFFACIWFLLRVVDGLLARLGQPAPTGAWSWIAAAALGVVAVHLERLDHRAVRERALAESGDARELARLRRQFVRVEAVLAGDAPAEERVKCAALIVALALNRVQGPDDRIEVRG